MCFGHLYATMCVWWSKDNFRESVLPFHLLAWVISFNNKLPCSPFHFVFDMKSSFGSYRRLIMWTPRCQNSRMCMYLIQIDTMFGGDDFFSQMSFVHACLTLWTQSLSVCVLWKCFYWIWSFLHLTTHVVSLSCWPLHPASKSRLPTVCRT